MGTYSLDIAVSLDELTGTTVGFITAGASCNTSQTNLVTGINSTAGVARVTNKAFCDGVTNTDGNEAARFGHDLSSSIISLDGDPRISFNSLPSGFRLLTEQVQLKLLSPFLTGTFTLEFDSFTVSSNLGVNTGGLTVAKAFNHPLPVNVLDMFTAGFGFRFAGIGVHLAFFVITEGKIIGNYDIFSSSITITPNPAVNGNEISINADGDLDDISELTVTNDDNDTVQTIPSADFTEFTVFLIRFILDISPNISGTYYIFGTTFSGSVLLGSIQIFVEDGSGIYRIVTNKRNDTVYIASSESPSTVDVKIPNPFGKTGFIGG